jgi:hypothetical protein
MTKEAVKSLNNNTIAMARWELGWYQVFERSLKRRPRLK